MQQPPPLDQWGLDVETYKPPIGPVRSVLIFCSSLIASVAALLIYFGGSAIHIWMCVDMFRHGRFPILAFFMPVVFEAYWAIHRWPSAFSYSCVAWSILALAAMITAGIIGEK
jgi:hypothetical protein